MSLFQEKFQPEKELASHFREMAEETSRIAALFGVRITPYEDSSLPHFAKLSEKKKLQALKSLSHQRDFFVMAQSEGLSPNSPQLIWRALAKMKMLPNSDIFDKITSEDTVEVYHWDHTTSFKNLVFFEYISLSLEDIYCLTWLDLYKVNAGLFLFFLSLAAQMKLGNSAETFVPRISRYRIGERRGEQRTFDIHLKWISPVTHEGRKQAMIFVNRSAFATDTNRSSSPNL